MKKYAQKSCALCRGFNSEVADLSAGDLGLEGWSERRRINSPARIVTGTKEGKKMFKSVEEKDF